MITGPARVWNPSDPALVAEVAARVGAGEFLATIGRDFCGSDGQPIPKDTVRSVLRRARRRGDLTTAADASAAPTPAGGGVTWTGAADGRATVESAKGGRVKTLDGLLSACEVDLTRWEVERFVVNKWETVMRGADGSPLNSDLFQVKAWLRPIPGVDSAREIIAGLIADLADRAPLPSPMNYPAIPDGSDRHMAVISLADHHIGALSWMPETGANYDMAIAEELAAEAIAEILRKVKAWDVERILFILGNDLMHVDKTIDGKGGATTRGTIQETDGRWQKMFRIATRVSIAAIDAARVLAPVDVHCKAGNHDTSSMFMLGDLIDAWYRNDPSVTVVNDPAPRTYVEYGVSAIGICHGHNEKPDKLPILMATEAADMWARATFRDWMTGHRHRKGILMNEESGVQIYTMPSLCAPDSWHVENAYGHRRSSEARIYHRDTGPAAHLIFNARRAA